MKDIFIITWKELMQIYYEDVQIIQPTSLGSTILLLHSVLCYPFYLVHKILVK